MASSLVIALASAALVQNVDPRHPSPVTVSDPPSAVTPDDAALEVREPVGGLSGGPYSMLPIERLDDAIPLPEPAVYSEGENGDELVAPAKGDPFFLNSAAGPHYPPADERIDPRLVASFADSSANPSNERYAFVMFAKRITDERLAELERLGVRFLGFHPHYTLKAAVTAEALEALAEHDAVRWVGLARPWQKRHPALARRVESADAAELLDVWINVFDSDLCEASTSAPAGSGEYGGPDGSVVPLDETLAPRIWSSNGWRHQALEELGVEVREWHEPVLAFRARIKPSMLEELVALDFVQYVEHEVVPTLGHDETMPMIHADYTRLYYDGGTSQAVVGGQCDTGIDYAHQGLTGFYWVGFNHSQSQHPTNIDLGGHGTLVAGTYHGSGAVAPRHEGGANRLGWGPSGRFFNVKAFNDDGAYGGAAIGTILNSLHGSFTDGSGFTTPRPHVVNHSWGYYNSADAPYDGTELNARSIDADVYAYQQLQVWIAHNYGPGSQTLSQMGSAKNAFTPGNCQDFWHLNFGYPGTIANSSGRGPTKDLRWKPNVVAPGDYTLTTEHLTGNGYTSVGGTSIAAPHVSAVAAQLCDHHPFLRHNPGTLAAVLMAGAVTKDNAILSTPSTASSHHLNIYGAGRIDSLKSNWSTADTQLYFWGWTQTALGFASVDVPVSSGATRITVVMTYNEVAASAGAGSALVNDLDLWIDQPPLTAGGDTGEWSAQQSTRDNTEIRILNNPIAGTWRLKVYPDSVTSNCKVGVCAIVSYGDTTPDGVLTVTADDQYVVPGEQVEITANYYNPEHFASAVFLDSFSVGDFLVSVTALLKDGVTAVLTSNAHSGRDVQLGNIGPNSSRAVTWKTLWLSEGVKNFLVQSRSDNCVDRNVSVNVYVDGTAPVGPSNLTSTTHQTGVSSCDTAVTMTWSHATDAISGIAGYRGFWDTSPTTLPSGSLNFPPQQSSYAVNIGSSTNARYFHLRAQDRSGNWGPAVHFGPVYANAQPITAYCTSKLNSAGCLPLIGSSGSPSLSGGQFEVRCTRVLNQRPGLMFWGYAASATPFQGGYKCVANPVRRTPSQPSGGSASGVDCTGVYDFTFSNAYLNANGVNVGDTLHAQWWMRDPQSPSTTGLSNGLRFTICL